MLFGRAFEQALGALFRREDPGAVLFAEWSACRGEGLHYSNGDSWGGDPATLVQYLDFEIAASKK